MPIYFYKAKNIKSKEESGYLEAEDKQALARILKKRGYFLISIQEKEDKKAQKFKISDLNFLTRIARVSVADKLFFTRNLEVMIKAGIPLPRAFEILSSQTDNKRFKGALKAISEKITKGENLSKALSSFPKIFPILYQETLRVGEETGKIEDSLNVLGSQMEKEYNLKSKIKTAMVYPGIILGMAFIIGILMMIFAIPNLKLAFEELNVELPFTTQLILGFSDFLAEKWWLALLIVLVLFFIFWRAFRTEKGGKIKSKLILETPIISTISKQANSALALRTLSSLLKAGVPIVRSLEITSGALSNFYFKKSLKEASLVVQKGKKISESLRNYPDLYSSLVIQMMEVGEETGETSKILEKLADFYDNEVANTTQKFSVIIEPVLIAIIGVIVGFFAISMMQPLFSIMGGI